MAATESRVKADLNEIEQTYRNELLTGKGKSDAALLTATQGLEAALKSSTTAVDEASTAA